MMPGIVLCLVACTPAEMPTALPTQTPDTQLIVTQQLDQQLDVLRVSGDFQQALWLIDHYTNTYGWTQQLHRYSAEIWQILGQYDRVAYHNRQIARFAPTPGVYRQLAEFAIAEEDWARALDWLAFLRQQNEVWAYFQSALILAPSDPNQATRYLDNVPLVAPYQALSLALLPMLQRPTSTTPYDVGIVLAGAGYWQQAENAFLYANTLAYPNASALAHWALMRALQRETFVEGLEVALALAPDDAYHLLLAGISYRLVGDLEASAYYLSLARDFAPANPIIYLESGITSNAQGDIATANAFYTEATRLVNTDIDQYGELLGQIEARISESTPESVEDLSARYFQQAPSQSGTIP